MTNLPTLLEALRALNRTERFMLVGWALAKEQFELGSEFRSAVEACCKLSLPTDCFVAMDYHLDWLHAALQWAAGNTAPGQHLDLKGGAISGSVRDVDLLVAYEEKSGRHHVILVEAKGFTGTKNPQLLKKAGQLKAIFGDEERRHPEVDAHFVLVGPKPSKGFQWDAWPRWMSRGGKTHFMERPPPDGPRYKVTRCIGSGEKRPKGGTWTHWKIEKSPWRGTLSGGPSV